MAVDYFSFYATGFPLGVSVPQPPSRIRRMSNRACELAATLDTLPCVVWAPLTKDDVEDIWGPLERGRPKAWEFRWTQMSSVVYPYELDRAAYEDTTRYPQQPVVVQFHPLFVEMTLRKLKLADGLLQLGFVSVERGNRRGLFKRAPALAECKYQTLRLKRRKARSGEDEEEWQSQLPKRPRGPGLSPTPSDTTEALSSASVSDNTDDDDDSAGRRFFEARNRQMQAYLYALLQLPESSNNNDNTSSAYDEVVPTITTTTTVATFEDQEPLIGLPDYCLDIHG